MDEVWIVLVQGRIDAVCATLEAATTHHESMDDDDFQRAEVQRWDVQ